MNKKVWIGLTILFCALLGIGCTAVSSEQAKQTKVYSFSGENDSFAIENGVIVLTPGEIIFYGGELKKKDGVFGDISAFSSTFYMLSGNEKEVILSNAVEDQTGEVVDVTGFTGKISGDILSETQLQDLQNNLYYELKTTDTAGEKSEFQLPLTVTEITE